MHLWRITNILKSKQEIGKIGEDIVCSYLEKNNYKIICRNYRTKTGEIDIIARDITKEIVFIEVKTRANGNYGKLVSISLTFLGKIIIPVTVAVAIKDRKWMILLIALMLQGYIYSVTGVKTYLFNVVIVILYMLVI